LTALAYEPFVLPARELETFIERVPSDHTLAAAIDRWKAMRADGWDLVALIAPDSKTVIALGCRGAA
jgi:DNA polymerase IIIc chi subunit